MSIRPYFMSEDKVCTRPAGFEPAFDALTPSTNVVLQAFLLKLCSFLSIRFNSISILVSVAGFEPATLRFQGGYSTQTELHTVYFGWSGTIRTCDLRNQSPIFYQLNYAP